MSFQNNRCALCHREFKLDMIVFLNTCHHGFCKSCARGLVMHEEYPNVQCPMDKIKSDHLSHFNKPQEPFGPMDYLFVNETTHDYLKHDIEDEPEYFSCYDDEKLSEYIILCNEAIHYFDYKLNLFKDTLEKVNEIVGSSHGENNAVKKMEIYERIEYLSTKLEEKISSIKEINCIQYTKFDILLEFIGDRNKEGDSLLDVNNVICILMHQYLLIFKKFMSEHFRYFNEPDIFTHAFYTNAIQAVNKEISTMKDLSLYLTMISISYLKDSRYLYKMIQPQVDEVTFKTCLICVKKIHGNHYGKFMKCEHKVCTDCIKKLWILEAHCPLDGDTTNRMEIVTKQTSKLNAWLHNPLKIPDSHFSEKSETPFDYLVQKFEKYCTKNFNEVFDYIVDKVKEIKSVLPESFKLLMDLQILFSEESKTYRDRELIKNTRINIIQILKITENNKFRYNDSISLMKFYGILASYKIMDSKCHKWHTFDALLEERIDELTITLNELVPFKKWLSTFEHLIDAVCMFMNNPNSEDHVSKIKEIIQEFIDAYQNVFYSYVNPAKEHLYYTTIMTMGKFNSLNSFIEAKKMLDKKFEKYKCLYETIREISDKDFK